MSAIPSPPDGVDAHTHEIRRRWARAVSTAPEDIRPAVLDARYASAPRLQNLIDEISNAPDFAGRDYILADLRAKLAAVERVAQDLARQADEAVASAPAGTQLEQLAGNPSRFLYRRGGRLYGIIQGLVTDVDGREHPARPGEVPTSYQVITPGRFRLRLGGFGGTVTTSKTATLRDAVNHITKRADAMSAEILKDMRAAREGQFDLPGTSPRPRKVTPGEVGERVVIEGGRTGVVWSDAPRGGRWVIPDERREGEAYAIYVDRRGRVDPMLSSREYQQQWRWVRELR